MNVQVLKNDLPAALAEGLAALRPFGLDLPPFPDEAMVDAQNPGDDGSRPGKDARSAARPAAARGPGDPRHAGRAPGALPPLLVLEPQQPRHHASRSSLENTLRHGLSEHAIYGCINFGMFLCGRGDIELGYRFGRAAINLSERYPDKKSEAMLLQHVGRLRCSTGERATPPARSRCSRGCTSGSRRASTSGRSTARTTASRTASCAASRSPTSSPRRRATSRYASSTRPTPSPGWSARSDSSRTSSRSRPRTRPSSRARGSTSTR